MWTSYPFFSDSLSIFIAGIQWFTGYYTVSLLSAFFQIIFPNNFYLWYLEALFFCFIIDYIIEKKCNSLTYQLCSNLMLCGIGIFASRVLGNYVPLGNPLKYVIWFWLGKNIDIIRAELRHYNIWSKRGVFLLFMLQVIFFSISRVFNRGLILIDNTILPILMLPVWGTSEKSGQKRRRVQWLIISYNC